MKPINIYELLVTVGVERSQSAISQHVYIEKSSDLGVENVARNARSIHWAYVLKEDFLAPRENVARSDFFDVSEAFTLIYDAVQFLLHGQTGDLVNVISI